MYMGASPEHHLVICLPYMLYECSRTRWELAHINAVIDLDVPFSCRTFLLDDSESRFIYTGEPLTPIQSTGKLH